VHDSGDWVVAADRPQRVQVLDISLDRGHWGGEASVWDLGTAALDEYALLAEIQQRLHGGAADVPKSSGYQDHHVPCLSVCLCSLLIVSIADDQ
jgi:hypothetical protein